MTEPKPRLLKLRSEDKLDLKVLFLARQAPLHGGARPDLDQQCGIEPAYNHELLLSLQELGLDCLPCRSLDQFVELAKQCNYVFTVYNRAEFRNSESYVSLQCEKLGIPYLGATPNVRALAEDKSFAKHVARSIGLNTAEWVCYGKHDRLEPPSFAGPYFVKPRFGAASDEVAVDSIQDSWPGLKARIERLLAKDKEVIVERCIAGTDLTVPVLGGNPPLILDVVEEISDLPAGIATYRQKRLLDKGRVRHMLDDAAVAQAVRQDVARFIPHVAAFDYLRVDFRLCRETRQAYFLEFNLGCNLGSHAAIMHAAGHSGIGRHQVIEHILAYSLLRQEVRRDWLEKLQACA